VSERLAEGFEPFDALSSPLATRNPANGRMSSDGIAGMTFSSIISRATPT